MRAFRSTATAVLCAALAAGAGARDARAQDSAGVYTTDEPARAGKEGKILHAFRITGAAPSIDGNLDDEVWTRAQTASEFVQWDPANGDSMTEATIMQVAYDNRFLYVAMRCMDRTPEAISSGLGRRDEQLPTDYVAVGVDPRHDHQTGYTFFVNPSGVQRDMLFYDDDRTDPDYDGVWEVRTTITREGWIAEYRIPFSQMRFSASPNPGQVWGFSGRRTIRRRGESGEWTGRPRGERGIVSRFGHLVFDAPLAPPRRVELQPYILGGVTQVPDADNDFGGSVGADLRVGLGTSATLSVTANPDFGQVEQDPAVLNLTVFETFFPEKRSFFLEDSRTFVPPYGLFQLFHSRRIGRRPNQFTLPGDATVVDRPEQTTIIGAVKLTGKAQGWTYGALSAATSREFATISTGEDGTPGFERRDFLIEPLTSYNVARVQRAFGNSNVGAIGTAAVRENAPDAYTGGVDYNVRWDRNRSIVNGHWALTRAPVAGVAETGFGGVMNAGFGRKHGGVNGHLDYFDEHFRPDDLGFFRTRPNRVGYDGNIFVEQPDPWKMLRRINAVWFGGQATTRQRLRLGRFTGVNSVMQFRNFWEVITGVERSFEAYDDLDTRGGPPILKPASTFGFLVIETDSRRTWRVTLDANHRTDAAGGWQTRFGPGVTLQPSTRLQAAIQFNYERGLDDAQWIKNVEVDGRTDHVYGTLDRDVLDLTVRATFAIHRDMTLQMFLQPFVAVGDYRNTRRLSRPSSYEFEPVALDENPDFSTKSLRGNVVLRWEYQRGSTMYVAWNMAGTDEARPGEFRAARDLRSAFGAERTQALLVKFNYWLSR